MKTLGFFIYLLLDTGAAPQDNLANATLHLLPEAGA
jgi:hypothetical protein